jgi:hypothetical protein
MTDRQRVGVDTTRRSWTNERSDRSLSRPEVAAVRQRHSDCVIMSGGLGGFLAVPATRAEYLARRSRCHLAAGADRTAFATALSWRVA